MKIGQNDSGLQRGNGELLDVQPLFPLYAQNQPPVKRRSHVIGVAFEVGGKLEDVGAAEAAVYEGVGGEHSPQNGR